VCEVIYQTTDMKQKEIQTLLFLVITILSQNGSGVYLHIHLSDGDYKIQTGMSYVDVVRYGIAKLIRPGVR
jgi:hypothetical protein